MQKTKHGRFSSLASFCNYFRFVRLLLIPSAALLAYLFCKSQTDGFAMQKIIPPSDFLHSLPIQPTLAKKDLQAILSQRFFYLGKGAQTYAFVSEDNQYVLKFPRYDHLSPRFWHSASARRHREAKRQQTLTSYSIAIEELKEETALLYLHFDTSHEIQQKITIIDNIGIVHQIDADYAHFALQKKADLLYPTLRNLMLSGKQKQAEELLDQVLSLLRHRCEKGIFDKDPNLLTNFGALGLKAMQIDFGQLQKRAPYQKQEIRAELMRVIEPLRISLSADFPELDHFLNLKLNNI